MWGKSTGSSPSTLLTGLKVYYAMENVNDSTATGDTLVNNNAATFVAGKVNNCVNFVVASSQTLTRANDAGNQVGTGDFTYCCWFKSSQTGNFLSPMAYGSRGVAGYRFEMNSGQLVVRNDDGTHVDTPQTSAFNFNDGNWHFACCTVARTGNTILYVDGSVAQSVATTATLTLNNSAGLSFGSGWNGNVDEAGIWSRALTPTEVGKLYNGLGSGIGTTYPFTGL